MQLVQYILYMYNKQEQIIYIVAVYLKVADSEYLKLCGGVVKNMTSMHVYMNTGKKTVHVQISIYNSCMHRMLYMTI